MQGGMRNRGAQAEQGAARPVCRGAALQPMQVNRYQWTITMTSAEACPMETRPTRTKGFERLDEQPEREAGASRQGPQRPRPGYPGLLQSAPSLRVCCQLSHRPVPWCRGQARLQSHLLSRAIQGRPLPLDCLHCVVIATLGCHPSGSRYSVPLNLRPSRLPLTWVPGLPATSSVSHQTRPLVPELGTGDLRPPKQTQPDSLARLPSSHPKREPLTAPPPPREVFPDT